MLERAAACVEPATLLFARRFEPPVRSNRVLGQSFWRNGGDQLQVPPWWPLYLQTVRQVPYSRDWVRQPPNASTVAKTSECIPPQRSRPSRGNPTPARAAKCPQQPTRLYSQSPSVRQVQHLQENEDIHPPDHRWHAEIVADGAEEQGRHNHRPANGLAASNGQALTIGGRHSDSAHTVEALSDHREAKLQQHLQRPPVAQADYHKAWALFVSLPKQEPLASAILAYLSKSPSPRDMGRALQAFSFIHLDDRSQSDYDAAVRVAVNSGRLAFALAVCQEAVVKKAAQNCRQVLLTASLSQGRYKTAAAVWTSSFEPFTKLGHETGVDWAIIDGDRALPNYVSSLCTKLLQNESVLRGEVNVLRACASALFDRIFKSTKIMAVITPAGAFSLFFKLEQLLMLDSGHFEEALVTLVSGEMRRRRADLAISIYRRYRFTFPERSLSTRQLCSLIILCDRERYPCEVFDYLFQELRSMKDKPHPEAYRYLMWAAAHQGDVGRVEGFFQHYINDWGPPKVVKFFNPRLHAHAMIGDVAAVERLLEDAKDHYALSPDLVTWNLLFFACARSKEPRRAYAAFDRMDKNVVAPDNITFGTLLGICTRVGDTLTALSLLDVAKDYGVPMTDDMLAMVAHSYCLNSEPEKAEELALSASKLGLNKPPIRIWNNVLRHYAFKADFKAIRRIRDSMSNAGIPPDDMTYATLLTSLVRVGKTVDALKLLRSLHFEEITTATSFHYSIILHGFAMEKNRDMVMLIYREWKDRFPRVSPSAQLTMLYTVVQRSWDNMLKDDAPPSKRMRLDLRRAVSFVNEIIAQTASVDRMTSEPQPGFKRRSALEAGSGIYTDLLARQAAFNRRPTQAECFINQYDSWKRRQHHARGGILDAGVEVLTTQLIVAAKNFRWTDVDKVWCMTLQRGVEISAPGLSHTTSAWPDPASRPTQVMTKLQSVLDNNNRRILPAMTYLLSEPFSFYMQALDQQLRHNELVTLVEDFQRLGFRLSSKNWNSYIQILCRSPVPEHGTLAYSLFDEIMLANTAGWRLAAASKWSVSSKDSLHCKTPVPIARKFIEQTEPGKITPSYFTLVFMASVLLKYRRQALRGDETDLRALTSVFPEVVRRIERIPYSRDKVRRVVLVGKRPHADAMNQPKYHRVLQGGIAGSNSPLDRVPVDAATHFRDLISSGKFAATGKEGSAAQIEYDIEAAELLSGETIRANMRREKRGGVEMELERQARIEQRTSRGLGEVEKAKQALSREQLVMDDRIGDPRYVVETADVWVSRDAKPPSYISLSPAGGARIRTRQTSELRKRITSNRVENRKPTFALTRRLLRPKTRRMQKQFTVSSKLRERHVKTSAQERAAIVRQRAEDKRALSAALRAPTVEAAAAVSPHWTSHEAVDRLIESVLPKPPVQHTTRATERRQRVVEAEVERLKALDDLLARHEGGVKAQKKPGFRAPQLGDDKALCEPAVSRSRGQSRVTKDQVKDSASDKEESASAQWKWDHGGGGFKF